MAVPGVVVVISACATQQTDTSQLQVSGTTETSTALPPGRRTVAPELRGTDLDGRDFDVATPRGKVVVVDHWASWCAPCREETPAPIRAARQPEPLGVDFVEVNIRDRQAFAQAFARDAMPSRRCVRRRRAGLRADGAPHAAGHLCAGPAGPGGGLLLRRGDRQEPHGPLARDRGRTPCGRGCHIFGACG
ncbi:TlpA family protein disulfide reductase [Nonomuraea sp. 10N515B]|uniref:TlpA family protein disulfide reductase n=1 Tax=Nonomuraea sp. 10N515B TaxID=3457422 RepID=UPI003FCDE81E